jgi:hypothetical protein
MNNDLFKNYNGFNNIIKSNSHIINIKNKTIGVCDLTNNCSEIEFNINNFKNNKLFNIDLEQKKIYNEQIENEYDENNELDKEYILNDINMCNIQDKNILYNYFNNYEFNFLVLVLIIIIMIIYFSKNKK